MRLDVTAGESAGDRGDRRRAVRLTNVRTASSSSRSAVVAVAAMTVLVGCRSDAPALGADVTVVGAAGTTTTTTALSTTTATTTPTTTTATTTTTTTATTTTTSTTTPTTTSTTTPSSTTTTSTTSTTTTSPPPAIRGRSGSIQEIRPPSDIAPPLLPAGWTNGVVGFSAQGREMPVIARTVVDARRTVLVIGGLHGNEPVTPPTVRGLVIAELPDDVEVWLVPEANPDGVAAGTRWNANGVDLNRNFSWDWRPSDGGPGPLSEPETQALTGLIGQLRPDVVVWVHQPLGYVGSIGPTDRAFEQAWAAGSGTPVRSGVTQHGGGESWTAFVAGLPSMLVEIDSWAATPEKVAAHRGGFETLVAALG